MDKNLVEKLYEDRNAVRKILNEYEDDWDLIDDLTHDVYAEALESEYDGASEPLTWLCGIAKNVGRMHVRGARADKRANEVLEVYIDGNPDDEGYAVEYYDRTDLSADIMDECCNLDPAREIEAEDSWSDALSRMPHSMAAVMQMRRDGYSNPEIAETLDKSEGYVRKLVSESRKFFDEGNNSQFNATNSVYSEREQRPVERFATQAELERAVAQRFVRRDRAFVARQARLRNPDATLAEWKEMYDV